jgi:5-methylcytosine-specific restriction endonuclease McrA
LTDFEPDYKAFEQEQVKQLEQQRKEHKTKNNGYVEKVTYICNHSKRRIQLEYKKIRDTYEYVLWRDDYTGTQVSKKEYDSYDLPERIEDQRF